MDIMQLALPFAAAAVSCLWAMSLIGIPLGKSPNRDAAVAAAFAALAALIAEYGSPPLLVPLYLLLGVAVMLLYRAGLLYTLVGCAAAALLHSAMGLMCASVGGYRQWLTVAAALILAAFCVWRHIHILPARDELLMLNEKYQRRKLSGSAALILLGLLLLLIWVIYLRELTVHLAQADALLLSASAAVIVLCLIGILHRLALDTHRQIEALVDKKYQAELLSFMQIIRSQRHDFNFHIQAISGLIENHRYEECDDYIQTMVKATAALNDMLPVHHPAVSAMLCSFRELAVQKGIEMRVTISNDLANIPCTVYETNTLIGNLLQNAVDEVEHLPGSCSWLELLILKRGGNHIIKVSNPCRSDASAFRACFAPGYTTKTSHEGIGLATVKRITEKYGGAVFPEFEDGVVSFIIQLPGRFA